MIRGGAIPTGLAAACALAVVCAAAAALDVALPGAANPAAAEDAEPARIVVRAKRLVGWSGVPDGPGSVVFHRKRFAEAGAQVTPLEGDRVLDAAVVTPGLMDAWTREDTIDSGEDPQPFGASLLTEFGVDPYNRVVGEAGEGGVLLRRVLPGSSNPIGGIPSSIHLTAPGALAGAASEERAVAFSFTAAATRRERYPGSLAGLVRALESAFDTASARKGEPFAGGDLALRMTDADLETLRKLAEPPGGRAYLHAETEAEVRAALRLAGERKLKAVLVGPRCGAEVILAAARASLPSVKDLEVIMALSAEDPLVVLRTPGLLAAAGARVRFGTGTHDAPPAALRLIAALAVRHGMDRSAAHAALLSPEIVRHELAAGAVLFDGDPLEPATRVVGVISGGVEVRLRPLVPADARKEKR